MSVTSTDSLEQIKQALASVPGVSSVRTETVIHVTTVLPKSADRSPLYRIEAALIDAFPWLSLTFGIEFESSPDAKEAKRP